MASIRPAVTIRLDSVAMKAKLQRMATDNGRTLSNQVAQILRRYLAQYEQKYGEIEVGGETHSR